MQPIIETDRLILRPLQESDASAVFEWAGDPMVNKYMPYPLHESPETARQWIESIKPENNEFGFVCKATGKLIGSGSVKDIGDQIYEVGYNLHRAFWGQGYATEAAKAMITWANKTYNATNFMARHATANTASGNVLRKCGFKFDHYGQYSRIDDSEIFEATYLKLKL